MFAPRKPKDDIRSLPYDLTNLDDEELMEYFAEYTSWANYISSQVAIAETDEAEAESKVEFAKAKSLVEGWNGEKGERVTVAKAARSIDDDVVKLQDEAAEKRAVRKFTTTFFNNMERNSAVISRELTRRVGSAPVDRRVGRYRG